MTKTRVSIAVAVLAPALALATVSVQPADAQQATAYAWRNGSTQSSQDDTVAGRIAPPAGFSRGAILSSSFAAWLRGLPLKPHGALVLLHSGQPKPRQDVHAAVVDIDVGARDLQQCADAVMRLRAEWLYASGGTQSIAFNDTGGAKPMSYTRWAAGERPSISGRALVWSKTAAVDASYASFRRYMNAVFAWAGTASLERELLPVSVSDIVAGDVFIKGGFPGHAVLVVDVATNAAGARLVLLAQSYMPAQSIHILKNPASADGLPWYDVSDAASAVVTPEWSFPPASLKRWR